MKRPLNLIALRTVRHTDRNSILTAYSLECGRIAFAIPAGAGREASRRRAMLMPLSIVECVADIRPGRDIHIMHEPRAVVPLSSLRVNPIKSSLAMFVAEFLGIALRDGPPDSSLYKFIAHSITILETLPSAGLANYHLWFLCAIGQFMGIAPDASTYRQGMIFDMIDGSFRLTPPLHRHFLSPDETAAAAALLRITPANMHLYRMTRAQRNEILDRILQYYSLHDAGMTSLRGLDILRSLF